MKKMLIAKMRTDEKGTKMAGARFWVGDKNIFYKWYKGNPLYHVVKEIEVKE